MALRKRPQKTVKELKIHARRRAAQRYGIEVTDQELEDAVTAIQKGRASCLYRESNTRSHFVVTIQGVRCRVVYNSKLKALATFLPPEERNAEAWGEAKLTG